MRGRSAGIGFELLNTQVAGRIPGPRRCGSDTRSLDYVRLCLTPLGMTDVGVARTHGETLMRAFVSAVLNVALINFCFAQAQPLNEIIPRNTPVEIELLDSLSSETLTVGQSVAFKLVKPLESNGVVLIPENTLFNGTVTHARASAHWAKQERSI